NKKQKLNEMLAMKLETTTMAVIQKEEGLQEPPEDTGIILVGVEVLHELTSVASACVFLLGLMYELILAYLKPFQYTFEALQKIIMQLEQQEMSTKVQIFHIIFTYRIILAGSSFVQYLCQYAP
uniref:Uncharacterized protein n=1 Tax=Amphilophus citrinellus TaxID=61819 RepID=A0A3Q0SD00_AMPCI